MHSYSKILFRKFVILKYFPFEKYPSFHHEKTSTIYFDLFIKVEDKVCLLSESWKFMNVSWKKNEFVIDGDGQHSSTGMWTILNWRMKNVPFLNYVTYSIFKDSHAKRKYIFSIYGFIFQDNIKENVRRYALFFGVHTEEFYIFSSFLILLFCISCS